MSFLKGFAIVSVAMGITTPVLADQKEIENPYVCHGSSQFSGKTDWKQHFKIDKFHPSLSTFTIEVVGQNIAPSQNQAARYADWGSYPVVDAKGVGVWKKDQSIRSKYTVDLKPSARSSVGRVSSVEKAKNERAELIEKNPLEMNIRLAFRTSQTSDKIDYTILQCGRSLSKGEKVKKALRNTMRCVSSFGEKCGQDLTKYSLIKAGNENIIQRGAVLSGQDFSCAKTHTGLGGGWQAIYRFATFRTDKETLTMNIKRFKENAEGERIFDTKVSPKGQTFIFEKINGQLKWTAGNRFELTAKSGSDTIDLVHFKNGSTKLIDRKETNMKCVPKLVYAD